MDSFAEYRISMSLQEFNETLSKLERDMDALNIRISRLGFKISRLEKKLDAFSNQQILRPNQLEALGRY